VYIAVVVGIPYIFDKILDMKIATYIA